MPRSIVGLAFALVVTAAAHAAGADGAVRLPRPSSAGTVSVEAALQARRSLRAYAQSPLSLAEAGQLLWAAQGITGPKGQRTAPSARARYPLEIVMVAQRVATLPPGAYRYIPGEHALRRLDRFDASAFGKAASQPHVGAAAAVFIVNSVDARMGSGETGRSWCDYEAGLASENLLLQAVALGLGGVVTGGIDTAGVKSAMGLPSDERVIVAIPIGRQTR